MSMSWPLIMDIIVAALLVATIAYAIQLSRRLAVLKDDRNHLQELIKGLQKATHQAEEAVGGLKAGAADAGRSLHQSVERAELLKSDLAFITERAEAAADRLETLLKTQREAMPAMAPIAVEPRPRRAEKQDADAGATQSRLATLLKHADAGNAGPRAEQAHEPMRSRSAPASAARPAIVPPRPAAVEPVERASVQSRAERDLLRALETRR